MPRVRLHGENNRDHYRRLGESLIEYETSRAIWSARKVKPYLEIMSGQNIFRKTGRVHRVEQIVDRENDRYYKLSHKYPQGNQEGAAQTKPSFKRLKIAISDPSRIIENSLRTIYETGPTNV